MNTACQAAPGSHGLPRLVERAGLWMAANRGWITALQWCVVVIYFALLIIPACLPLPDGARHMTDSLTLIAQFVFWGIWWPGVILATMSVGRLWCGTLCPEGALTEWTSRFGRGLPVPRWLKWSGWPTVAFITTTLYGQLISVYEYPLPALLILGGSTAAAIVVGSIYGRGKRVWCRHLCPASGVFHLMSRMAPLYFKVDRSAWDNWLPVHIAGTRDLMLKPVDCAPLVDVRRMTSSGPCHACGRCAGHRDAVRLALRAPSAEILSATPASVTREEVLTLCLGLLGVATGAFHWSMSPWFVMAKQWAAQWLIEREWWWALSNDIPWFVLTHFPENNDVFSWLDGFMILAYIGATTVVVGGGTLATSAVAAWLSDGRPGRWKVQAITLLPLGGVSVIVGLSMTTVTLLRGEGFQLSWISVSRVVLLGGAGLWAASLALRQIRRGSAASWRRWLAAPFALAAPALVCSAWYIAFRVW
ncbi:4Fe-4S binding protein [Uliginosibacterium gangwonense]|uniref:4Fe-4S binding protein n=1 Tax=Uliginosibacterium gangwonense TaxID=392736 RepID=UPI0003734C04|nr:4Fe-4S binding protein [Uliginosibacterium gangwonense]